MGKDNGSTLAERHLFKTGRETMVDMGKRDNGGQCLSSNRETMDDTGRETVVSMVNSRRQWSTLADSERQTMVNAGRETMVNTG